MNNISGTRLMSDVCGSLYDMSRVEHDTYSIANKLIRRPYKVTAKNLLI